MKIKYKKAPDGSPDWLDDSSPFGGEYSCGPAKSWWLFTILPWKTCHKFGSPLFEHTHGGLIGPPCLWVALKVSKLSWNGASSNAMASFVFMLGGVNRVASFFSWKQRCDERLVFQRFLFCDTLFSSLHRHPFLYQVKLWPIAALLHWPLLDTVGPLASVHYFYSLFGWSEGDQKNKKSNNNNNNKPTILRIWGRWVADIASEHRWHLSTFALQHWSKDSVAKDRSVSRVCVENTN